MAKTTPQSVLNHTKYQSIKILQILLTVVLLDDKIPYFYWLNTCLTRIFCFMVTTYVCVSSYFKGAEFIEECHALGNQVYLITSEKLRHENWPWHAIKEVFYMQEESANHWNLNHLILGFANLLKNNKIHRVVALDDYDVEKVALIRETFRIDGMGQTTQRYFRDKLAMRYQAQSKGIKVPAFTAIFNDEEVNEFANKTPAPWVLKPRSEASASGIQKIHDTNELWQKINALGEQRYQFLLEQFKPGNVYHVDALVNHGNVIFTSSSGYLTPPMQTSQQGGVFRTMILDHDANEAVQLKQLNQQLLQEFGLKFGASHTEFIRCYDDNEWYFLETSARVGGAFIPNMVEAATGINLWHEWARIEYAQFHHLNYQLPKAKHEYAALLICLAHEKEVDLSDFKAKELLERLPKDYHIALLYQSKSKEKITRILEEHTAKVNQYVNVLPPLDKPNS